MTLPIEFFSVFPHDLNPLLFSYFSAKELVVLTAVSKQFRELALDLLKPIALKKGLTTELKLSKLSCIQIIELIKNVRKNENERWKSDIQKCNLDKFISEQLNTRKKCSTVYFPSSTTKKLSSKELQIIFNKLPFLKNMEFEREMGESFDTLPITLLGKLFSAQQKKIKALSLINIPEVYCSEPLTYLCHQAISLRSLTVINCGLYIDIPFFTELFAFGRQWKSITYIGKGEINDSCIKHFFLSPHYASRFTKLRYLKLVTTECSVSEETRTQLKNAYPHLNFHLSECQKVIEPVVASTETTKATGATAVSVTVIEPKNVKPPKIRKPGFWKGLIKNYL